jgi:hypothetical protein
MAATNPISAFPAWTDRDRFGDLLSGFCDGEGCFILSWRRSTKSVTGIAKFVVSLRDDDRPILDEIQAFLGCGTVHARIHHASKPQSRLSVSRVEQLVDTVIPTFERYPLRAKKRHDFPVWCEGVRLIYRVVGRPMTSPGGARGFQAKWTDHDRTEFRSIADALRSQRLFGSLPTSRS